MPTIQATGNGDPPNRCARGLMTRHNRGVGITGSKTRYVPGPSAGLTGCSPARYEQASGFRHHEPDTLRSTQRPRPACPSEGHLHAAADAQSHRHHGIAASSLAANCVCRLAESVKTGSLAAYDDFAARFDRRANSTLLRMA